MSEYYKPNRGAAWNYGGKNWRLSRSKIDLFLECPHCFYLDNKLGVKRVPGFPFNLNSAVDHLLKKEFDFHRAKGTGHPLMKKYCLDLIPFKNEKMDEWRDSLRKGVQYFDTKNGFTVSGGVDDIWVDKNGDLTVVDYKATSKDKDIVSLDESWQDGYKRQMEVYQWLLRKNGFKVSDRGYFVYCNGKTDKEAFDAKLEFDVNLVPYDGNDSWIEKTLDDIKKCLEGGTLPASSENCDYCSYCNSRNEAEKNK